MAFIGEVEINSYVQPAEASDDDYDCSDFMFNTKPLRLSDGNVLTLGAPEAESLSVPDDVREACEKKRVHQPPPLLILPNPQFSLNHSS